MNLSFIIALIMALNLFIDALAQPVFQPVSVIRFSPCLFLLFPFILILPKSPISLVFLLFGFILLLHAVPLIRRRFTFFLMNPAVISLNAVISMIDSLF